MRSTETRCDTIIDLIDRCLADYDSFVSAPPRADSTSRARVVEVQIGRAQPGAYRAWLGWNVREAHPGVEGTSVPVGVGQDRDAR